MPTKKSKNDNQKSSKKSEKFYIINNVFQFSNQSPRYEKTSSLIGTGGEGLGAGNFIWPDYKNEKDRIRKNTKKYESQSISTAFEEEYNIKLPHDRTFEDTPTELHIGDVVNVRILDVSKRHVVFDTRNIKDSISSSVDLYKFKRFKAPFEYLDVRSQIIKAKVVDISHKTTKVDVITPLIESFVRDKVKTPWIQKEIGNPHTVKVTNLKLTRGGFIGKVNIQTVSDFIGEPYYVEAFIPGSQIVLNITDNFEQFIGKDVDAFVVNYLQKPGSTQMSLICSVKSYLRFMGESLMIDMFKNWCDNNKEWGAISKYINRGVVTGVINSSKKCGIFVELPDLHITGMVSVPPTDLVKYKPGNEINVKIDGFEEEVFYNPVIQQTQHVEPYKITNGCIEKCTLKPILSLVTVNAAK